MAFNYPDKPWFDGQTVRREMDDDTVLIGTYNLSKNLWSFGRSTSDASGPGGIVTTADVFTLSERPAVVASPFDSSIDLVNQQEANWFLYDSVTQVLWIDENPPPLVDGEQVFKLWFHTETLELLIYYNGQWFPVSIPPTQVNVLKEIVEGLEVSITQVRGDIAKNKIDIDELGLDLREEIDDKIENLEEEIDGKLATLEEELEQLAPSLERGTWNWVNADLPGPGEYSMKRNSDPEALAQCDATLQECLINAGDDLAASSQCNRDHAACKAQYGQSVDPDFSKVYVITFNKEDSQGINHTFSDVQPGTYLDIFNDNDDGFIVAEVTLSIVDAYILVFVNPIQSKGFANGLARLKAFTSNDAPELTNYVRKDGDTMTGTMIIKPDTGKYGLTVYPGPEAVGTTADIFTARNYDGRQVFYVDENGDVGVDPSWSPTRGQQLVTKKYVDDQLAALRTALRTELGLS